MHHITTEKVKMDLRTKETIDRKLSEARQKRNEAKEKKRQAENKKDAVSILLKCLNLLFRENFYDTYMYEGKFYFYSHYIPPSRHAPSSARRSCTTRRPRKPPSMRTN